MPGNRISNGSEEKKDLIHENMYKGIHDVENNTPCRAGFFRHFCHLSCFVVRDCHSPLSFEEHFVLMPVWLKANQSVCTSWEFGVHCDAKRDLIETILVVIISLTSLSETIQKKKNHCSFVGSCLVSTVFRHVWSTQKEQLNNRTQPERLARASECFGSHIRWSNTFDHRIWRHRLEDWSGLCVS